MPAIVPALTAALAASLGATLAAIVANIIGMVLSAALSFGLSALTRPKAPSGSSLTARRDELQSSVREAAAPREIVLGKMRKGGKFFFIETVNNERDLLLGVELAGHEVEGIDEIYFFDELAIDQKGTVQPKFAGKVEYEKGLGGDSQAASQLLLDNFPGYTADDRQRGIARLVLKLTFDREVFSQIPNVTAVVRGHRWWDTRDSTTRYTTNPAICLAGYLNDPLYGLEAPYATEIDNDLLNASANVCDEDVAIKAGKTLQFDGVDDVVTIGDVLDQTGSFSVEARVRPSVVNIAGQKVVDKDNGSQGWSVQIEQDKVRFITRGLSNVTLDTGTGQMVADTWKHIACVWNSSTGVKTIYVNGVSQASATSVTGTMAANATSLKIGQTPFKGRIQDVRLWSEARGSTAVAQYDDKSLQGTESNLVGYWRLDEKRGTVAEDATETPNDGTISGAAWVDDASVLGTQKRYACNGVVFSDQTPSDIILDLLSSMAGNVNFSGGYWLIRAGAFDTPTVTLNENDCRGALRIQTKRSRRDLFNAVRGTYAAPENSYQTSDFPLITNTAFEVEDGPTGEPQRIVQEIQLPMTTDSSMAQRLAWLQLLRNREQVSLNYPCKLTGLRLRAGDFVAISNARLGWDGKAFEVIDWQFVQVDDDQGVPALGIDLELREAAAAVYDFNPATDEAPMKPAPDTNLPSPFGNMALVSGFVERTGFTEIAHLIGAGAWSGTSYGFVHNPRTGHLNVDDLLGADANDFDVFDSYVQTPATSPYYESPELDIGFDDTVRTFVQFGAAKGAGEVGSFGYKTMFDYKLAAGEYAGFQQIHNAVKAEGRYFKYRVELDTSSGAGGYLSDFTAVVDKTTVFQSQSGIIVNVGGRTIEFPMRYHNVPVVQANVTNAAARHTTFTSITETDFNLIVFDSNADDVGGIIGWSAQGV